jgi:hypothetical protein
VLVQLADLEIFEIKPAALVPLDRVRHRLSPEFAVGLQPVTAIYGSFTIITHCRKGPAP